jgi:integrase
MTMEKKKTDVPGLYKLADGRYQARVTAKVEGSGKMAEQQRTYPKGTPLKAVLADMDALREDLKRDTPDSPQRITIASYAVSWLQARSKLRKPGTIATYRVQLAQHILPELGELYLDTLTRADVEAWIIWAQAQRKPDGSPYARQTVTGWWDLLCMLIRDAVADLGLDRDPTARLKGPQLKTPLARERRTLSAEQVGRWLDALEEVAPSRWCEGVVLAYTGMRAGELLAAEWADVDWSSQILTVSKSTSKGKLGGTKTGTVREVYLPELAVQALRVHQGEQLRAQAPGIETGRIFPGRGGALRDAKALAVPFEQASRHAGLDIKVTPQVLRRTYNTLGVAARVDRLVLRRQMGHTREDMTDHYYEGNPQDRAIALATILPASGEGG